MNNECTYTDDVSNCHSTTHRIPNQPLSNPLTLIAGIDRESSQNHEGYWVSRQAFGESIGRIPIAHFAYGECVKPNHLVRFHTKVGL